MSGPIFADGRCPECGGMCGNNGGDRLRCSCGWESEPLNLEFPDPVQTPVGEWFKAYRRKYGITVREAHEAMECLPSEVSAIEHRGRIPHPSELSRFIKAFHVPPEEASKFMGLVLAAKREEPKERTEATMKEWEVCGPGGEWGPPYSFLRGKVYGHPNFEDGTLVTTSAVLDFEDRGDYVVATTENTLYTIRKEDAAGTIGGQNGL